MLIDGRAVAERVYTATKACIDNLDTPPQAMIITCAPQGATRRYLDMKQVAADRLGIILEVCEYASTVSTDDLVEAVIAGSQTSDAVIVQLPLPPHIDTQAVLAAIPPDCDVDGLTTDSSYLSPVVGSIQAIAEQYEITFVGAQVVVVGAGPLVGKPVAAWSRKQGAIVSVVDKESPSLSVVADADVVIAGTGVPHLIGPSMVREGVVIFDAGTAEANGMLLGDVDPACAEKASLMTPVPGGIGPITIAILMENITTAAVKRSQKS